MAADVEVREVSAEAVRPLRHSVLRPGRPFDETVFAGDDDPDTCHLGAFVDGDVVGIASLYREPRPGRVDSRAWRLRGMATAPGVRGQGVGRSVLAACVQRVADRGGGELWCNARIEALGFYTAAGFEITGEPFDVPGVGPHRVAHLTVAAAPANPPLPG